MVRKLETWDSKRDINCYWSGTNTIKVLFSAYFYFIVTLNFDLLTRVLGSR